ncbi:MAG: integration host factor subunit beta [Sedimenticola sp.]|nr:integration host factor subunit beta [Sedimenticola sp.]
MKETPDTKTAVSDRALELIMRDVLDGLFELSLESSFSAHSGEFEILEIRPDQKPVHQQSQAIDDKTKADVINFPGLKRACG